MQALRNSIVFINQNSGYLMIDLIRAHQDRFARLAVITGRIVTRNNNLDASIKLEKIIAYNRSSIFTRLVTWTWGFLQIVFLVKTKYRSAELYIVSNPPFATLLPIFCRNKFHLLIFDVYPDALVEYKILKGNSMLVRMWRWANRRVFQKASNIFTLANGMKKVLSQYVDASNINVGPIWTDNSFLKPVAKIDNPFIAKHRLGGKFVVMYSGNLGRTHDVEVLVNCAIKTRSSSVVFVVIGEGEKRKALEEAVNVNCLKNFLILPWQDVQTFPLSLAAADLGVVTLGKQASSLSVPSKAYNLLSVGAPLLCIAGKESELSSLVDRYEVGMRFDASDVDAMVDFIERLAFDRMLQQQLRSKALKASESFGPENVWELVV